MQIKFGFVVTIWLLVLTTVGCASPVATETSASPSDETSAEQTSGSAPVPATAPTPKIRKTSKTQSKIAVGDRQLWTQPINTLGGFDQASRAAILVYALGLEDQKNVELKTLNRPSVKKWLDKELELARRNYEFAVKTCQAADWTCGAEANGSADVIETARALAIPPTFVEWRENMREFVQIYVAEQVRLAAAFPTTSTEVDLFNTAEWNGETIGDRKFFLTFDDGPTAAGGDTDGVLQMLAEQKKNAVFFVVGQNFANRQNKSDAAALARVYQGQCVAAHGWEHLSHQKRSKYAVGERWQTSVTDTIALLKKTFANGSEFLPLFRPPYGQRKADSGAFFERQKLQVALWNLDSQDWNSLVDAEDIINRMTILMLIKRHGVLLFHDVHPKAKKAVPVIVQELGGAVEWADCHQIGG